MITLFVIMLTVGSGNAEGWVGLQGQTKVYRYETVSECQAARQRLVVYANTQENMVLIDSCGTERDSVKFEVYGGKKSNSPVQMEKPNA